MRSSHVGKLVKGRYYLFGGKFSDQRLYSTIEYFDCEKREWFTYSNSLSENRVEQSMDFIEKYLVLFGGYENHRIYNELKLFNIEKSAWTVLQPRSSAIPSHRYGHSSLVINSDLYVFGGMDKNQTLNDLWRFNFSESKYDLVT